MDAAPIPPPPPETAPSEPSSLTDRLTNVIAAPGEVFPEIKNAPVRSSNWLVPLILACIATVIYVSVAFSQPPFCAACKTSGKVRCGKKLPPAN